MRKVPTSMTDAWRGQAKIGEQRPIVRATVQKQNLRRYEYDTAYAQGGDYNDRHRSGYFASFIFGDTSGYVELRNIRSCEWERSVGQDAATCTLTLMNSEIVPIGSPRDNPTSPDEFDKPGYFTFNRGDQTVSANRWGYTEETGWNSRLVPDMVVKTYEGYGRDLNVTAPLDSHLVQSGTWLIDKVTYSSTGDITLEMRDLSRILLDNVVFPPAIPFAEYPLSWIKNHTENVTGRDAHGGSWVDRLNRFGSATSSNSVYEGRDLTNQPYPRYVGPNGGVDGHHAGEAILDHNGTSDNDLFWRSTGQDAYHDFVWWQYNANSGTPVGGLRMRMNGGPFRVYISIHDGTKWVGKRRIPYHLNGETGSPGNVDIDAGVPFVKSVIADRYYSFDAILPRVYNARKIRLTFTRLRETSVGEHPYRAGFRELQIYTANSVSDITFGDGHVNKVLGNYGDYTHIIKWVCAWAGWYWPPHSTGDDFIRTEEGEGAVANFVTFVNPDPALPKGRVWGDFMKTGTSGIADLTVDLFDKKPLMDIINYVRDLLGFLFFIDETGGVVWRMPNLGMGGDPKLGNYLSPEDTLVDGVRTIGNRGRHGRTSEVIVLDETQTLLSYSTVLDSADIRDRIFVANAVGGVGVVIKGFNPYSVGFRRVAGWTDQHFANKGEAKVMADMISAQQMFTYRRGQAVIPGYPAIQIDDQVRIFERVTNETFYHYVSGIKSTLDMQEGDWTYELSTHWLGERPSDAWVVKVDELSDVTQRYLAAVGYHATDAEDNDDLVGGSAGADRGGDTTGGGDATTGGDPGPGDPPPPPDTGPATYINLTDFTFSSAGLYFPSGTLTGAGMGLTIYRLPANTSTKVAPTVPMTTNQLKLIRAAGLSSGSPSTVHLQNFTVEGTAQPCPYYNGVVVQYGTGSTVTNVRISGIPGNASSPPGETFSFALFHSDNTLLTNLVLDGYRDSDSAQVAATLLGYNFTTGTTTANYLVANGARYGFAAALWRCQGRQVFNNCNFTNSRKAINIEQSLATAVDFNDCDFRGTAAPYVAQVTAISGISTVVTFRDPIVTSFPLKVNCYGPSSTNTQQDSDIHLFIGGVDKTNDPTKLLITHL